MPDMRRHIDAVKRPTVVTAPEDSGSPRGPTLFLAGSIDMGAAVEWQKRVIEALADMPEVTIFNPRRTDWDSSWEQDISHPEFNEQVTWEMDHLDKADVICFYFDAEGKAPITLLELGLHAADRKCVVCCPEGYWRRGNVQMVCDRFNIPMVDDLEALIEETKRALA